jgi:hypothetical protein
MQPHRIVADGAGNRADNVENPRKLIFNLLHCSYSSQKNIPLYRKRTFSIMNFGVLQDRGRSNVGTGPGLYIILSVTFFGAATSQAAIQKVHVKHHHVRVVKTLRIDAAPRRVCDWIGPGGRAIYRCGLVDQVPPRRRAK